MPLDGSRLHIFASLNILIYGWPQVYFCESTHSGGDVFSAGFDRNIFVGIKIDTSIFLLKKCIVRSFVISERIDLPIPPSAPIRSPTPAARARVSPTSGSTTTSLPAPTSATNTTCPGPLKSPGIPGSSPCSNEPRPGGSQDSSCRYGDGLRRLLFRRRDLRCSLRSSQMRRNVRGAGWPRSAGRTVGSYLISCQIRSCI